MCIRDRPEVGLGITPGFGGTQRLSKLVGKGMAKMLILTADTINAEEALRIGLVEKVTEPEQLISVCEEIAAKIASKAPIAVAMSKTCINKGYHLDLFSGSALEAEAFGGLSLIHICGCGRLSLSPRYTDHLQLFIPDFIIKKRPGIGHSPAHIADQYIGKICSYLLL